MSDPRIALELLCDEEPSWWRRLAEKARVRTDFNGRENWKITLSRLRNAGYIEHHFDGKKHRVYPTPRGTQLLNKE